MLNEIKKERCFYIICASVIMLCIALICFFSYTKEDKYADSIEDLKVKISYDTTKESVNIWKSDEGTYYCFLPSGALKNKLNFSGVSKNAVLKFDSVAIDKKTDLSQIENLINDKHTLEINYGGQIQKIDLVFLCSSNLQTVFIDTDKVDLEVLCESKDNFDSAQMRIYSDSEKKLSAKIDKIHCRGASSFTTADKKSFSFKTNEEEKLLGMKSSQKWCLIANRFDSSFMHNKLAYDYFREYTDIPSSESSYVDLYINGEYEGNYLLCHNAGDIVEIEKSYDLEEK